MEPERPAVRPLRVVARTLICGLAMLSAFVGALSISSVGADVEPAPAPDLADRIQILGIDETPTEDGAEVVLEVAVPPAIGRLVASDENFAVTDGGPLVDVVVAPVTTASDTVIVLDTSGSMRGSALTAAKVAASSFVEALPEDTRVGLISFGETVKTHQSPTLDRPGLLAELDALEATGDETVLWDALTVAAELVGGSATGHSSIVVLSDGDDTNSTVGPAEVVDRIGSGSSVLYAVAIESPDTDLIALEETVGQVDGQFLATTDIEQLDSLYADIAGRLANRYELRFASAQVGERTVVVSVASDGGVATARTTIGQGTRVVDGGSTPDPAAPSGTPPLVLNIDDQPVLGVVAATPPGRFADPTMFWIGLGSIFAALAIVGLNFARPRAPVRLNAAASVDRIGGVNARLGQSVDRLISSHDRGHRFDARLEAADINLRPGEFVLMWFLGTTAATFTGFAIFGVAFAVFTAVASALVAFLVLSIRSGRRRARFADQLTDTLGIMASSLRSGQSLPQSVELVASEAPSPTAEEFHRIAFEIRVGMDLTDSIRDAAARVASPDLEWLAQAVDINRELGGDLTEILDNVATTIRERRTVARQIDALSAEGRASGWVLLAMPIALFLFSWWRTPDSIQTMVSEPIGRILLGVAVSGMVVGHLWVRRLVKFKF